MNKKNDISDLSYNDIHQIRLEMSYVNVIQLIFAMNSIDSYFQSCAKKSNRKKILVSWLSAD